MTLEQQVTSLEISKRLKELRVKQEGIFFWVICNGKKEPFLASDDLIEWRETEFSDDFEYVATAFTVAEIGEMLPDRLYDKKEDQWFFLRIGKLYDSEDHYEGWTVEYRSGTNYLVFLREQEITEANARGKMLIYLLENKLI